MAKHESLGVTVSPAAQASANDMCKAPAHDGFRPQLREFSLVFINRCNSWEPCAQFTDSIPQSWVSVTNQIGYNPCMVSQILIIETAQYLESGVPHISIRISHPIDEYFYMSCKKRGLKLEKGNECTLLRVRLRLRILNDVNNCFDKW